MSEARWVALDLTDSDGDAAPPTADPAELIEASDLFARLLQRPAWHAKAACRGQGPSLWFPGRGATSTAARAVCDGCPVRADCLSQALSEPTTVGIWGGTGGVERSRMRRDVA